MSLEKCCTEAPELIALCERCINPDCTSDDGCKTYKALKKKIAQRDKKAIQPEPAKEEAPAPKPAIELAAAPAKIAQGTAETLLKCNAAITALEALHSDDGCFLIFDAEKIGDALRHLKEARMREYGALIDWNAIAERIQKYG